MGQRPVTDLNVCKWLYSRDTGFNLLRWCVRYNKDATSQPAQAACVFPRRRGISTSLASRTATRARCAYRCALAVPCTHHPFVPWQSRCKCSKLVCAQTILPCLQLGCRASSVSSDNSLRAAAAAARILLSGDAAALPHAWPPAHLTPTQHTLHASLNGDCEST